MDMQPTNPEMIALPSPDPCVTGGRAGLSQLQRDFALHFVATGGKGRRAAILAGYSANTAHVSAFRNLANAKVLHEVDRLCKSNIKAALPVAIRALIRVCMSSKDDRAVVQAASKLVELGGMVPRSAGPAVQVNLQVNGQQAQTIIGEVWQARERRLSDIPAPMSDDSHTIDATPQPQLAAPAGDPGRGGVEFQGPIPGTSSIPPPSRTPAHFSAEGMFDGEGSGADERSAADVGGSSSGIEAIDAAAAWRAATAARGRARAEGSDEG